MYTLKEVMSLIGRLKWEACGLEISLEDVDQKDLFKKAEREINFDHLDQFVREFMGLSSVIKSTGRRIIRENSHKCTKFEIKDYYDH